MITEVSAVQHVNRLSGLPGWPRTDDGQAELARALLKAAPTEYAAQHLIDEALATFERCPPPQFFYAAAPKRTERRKVGLDCRVCSGVGTIEWPYLARPDDAGVFQTERLALIVDELPTSPNYQLAVKDAVRDWRNKRATKLRAEGVENIEFYCRFSERLTLFAEPCPSCRG